MFSFYFAQAGSGLTIFFFYVLTRGGAMDSAIVSICLGIIVMLTLVALGLMTALSVSPHGQMYMLAAAGAFVLYYVTVHIALGGAPSPGLFAGTVGSALAHLVLVWLLWHHAAQDLEIV